MDAAKTLRKNSALFHVLLIALCLAAPAWAQPAFRLSTTSVTCAGTSCPGGDVTVDSTGGTIIYNVNVDYSGDANNPSQFHWLNVNPSSGTTSPTNVLQISLGNFSILPQGNHSAVVRLDATDGSGAAEGTITVSFTTGGSSGGNGSLFSSINPIVQNVATGNSSQVTTTITTTSAANLALSISTQQTSCNTTQWLTAALTGVGTINSSTSTTVQVTLNATNLATQSCTGTVILTPSAGTALNVPVTMNVNGSGGSSGSYTFSQNPVNLSYNSGSGAFPVQTITFNNSTNQTNFFVSNCVGGWLAINGLTSGSIFGNTFTVQVGSLANQLSTGTFTCTVQFTDFANANVNGVLTVNLQVNGGSNNGLTINPTSLSFSAPVGGTQQFGTLVVSSATGGVLNVVPSSAQGWLTFQSGNVGQTLSPNAQASITVYANPSPNGQLGAGTYNGTVTVQIGSQSQSVPVTFVVGGGGANGTLVAPASLNFVYILGTPPNFVARQSIAITGPAGPWSSSITTNTGGNWLTISPTSGNLPDQNQTTVVIQPAALSAGTYAGTITFNTPGGTASVTVNLSVISNGPILIPQPGSLIFNYQTGNAAPAAQGIFPTNSDSSALNYTVTANDSWVQITQQAGSNVFSVSVDPTGKAAGVYTSGVTIVEPGAANSPINVPVVLVVSGNGGIGTLQFNVGSISFTSSNGSIPAAQGISVTANSPTTFTVQATSTGGSWLSVTPTSGTTPSTINVSASPSGLGAGTYNGTLTFSSNGNVQTIPVSFTVSGNSGGSGNVTVTCLSSCDPKLQPAMAFNSGVGTGTLPIAGLKIVSASGSAGVAFTVQFTTQSGGSWLSTNAGSTTFITPFAESNPFPILVNITGLAPGTYSGNIAIQPQGGTTVNVPVTLVITAPPTITATPTSLSFSFRSGDSNPPSQTINVSGGGAALTFSVTASPSGSWLSASPATGTTTATGTVPVTVTVNPTGLSAGTYSGTVTINGTGGAAGTVQVNVTLTVTTPLPTVARVVNAASYQANSISPGEIITLFASDASHAIGPSTPVGLQLDSTGKVATTLGGVQVLINGFACPLIYVSATQISAIVPYEVAPLATVSVIVRFLGQSSNGTTLNVATTSPGIFTLNSSGSGPAAVINQNLSVNSPNNPANRGDGVSIYMTGEGQTSPPGVTGKVTTVSSTPPFTPGPLLPIGVTIGGVPAAVTFAGEAPQFVSGVLQLNVTIPAGAGSGDLPLVVNIGGNATQTGVTISVR